MARLGAVAVGRVARPEAPRRDRPHGLDAALPRHRGPPHPLGAEFVATWGNGGAPPDECEAEPEETPASVPEQTKPLPLFPNAEPIRVEVENTLLCPETDRAILDRSEASFRKQILERGDRKCTYPGCNARDLHVHHIELRSHGGPDEAWNCTTLRAFHHKLLHAGQIRPKGRAPYQLEWTPPKLMREVIERRRNRPALWVGELEVREWPADPELALA